MPRKTEKAGFGRLGITPALQLASHHCVRFSEWRLPSVFGGPRGSTATVARSRRESYRCRLAKSRKFEAFAGTLSSPVKVRYVWSSNCRFLERLTSRSGDCDVARR